MNYVLLVLHITTAIVFIGGLTVAASIFPRYATPEAAAQYPDTGVHPAAVVLHRITRVYGRLAAITPVLGLVLAASLGKLDQLWVILALGLVVIGGILLVVFLIPQQRRCLADPTPGDRRRLMGLAGTLNLIWIVILILMITKPGGSS